MDDIVIAIVFTTLILLLLISGVLLTIIIANRQRIAREVMFEKELRTVEQEVREQLLTGVSQELHDNIGQMLTVLHLQLKKGQITHPDSKPLLQPMGDTLNDTIEQVKVLARGLNSEMVQDNGLLNNINQDVERLKKLERFAIEKRVEADEILLSKDIQLMVFRIYQEVMNNIMKHSEATIVNIYLSGVPFRMEVHDNGKGFAPADANLSNKGMGLGNIEKRAKLAGLNCSFTSSENKGCIFMLYEH